MIGRLGDIPLMKTEPMHRERIQKAFSLAATYDEHARVQRIAAEWLTERLAVAALPQNPTICEIGCGTGFLSEEMGRRIPQGLFLATDLCSEMLQRARLKLGHDTRFEFATVDGEKPEILKTRAPFDIICSNLTVQWFTDLGGAIRRLLALLRPNGRLLFTTLAANTFWEWRQAHARCGFQAGTPAYPTRNELEVMAPVGTVGKIDIKVHVESFDSGPSFLRSLRGIGAHTPSDGHVSLNAGHMRRVLREFERLPQATYEIAVCEFQRDNSEE